MSLSCQFICLLHLQFGSEEECSAALEQARQETRRALQEKITRRRNAPAGGYTDEQLAEAVDRAYQDFAVSKVFFLRLLTPCA